jgi:large subunit ribosomal protein L22
MEFIAEQKNTRQTARKVRLVANAVRKLPLDQALKQLAVIERRASLVVTKVLRQALANAWHNHNLPLEQLELKNILVNEGTTYKRWRAVSRGRAHTIFKRTAHVRVILATKADAKPSAKVATKSTKDQAIKAKSEVSREDKPTQVDVKAKTGMAAPFKSVAHDQVKARPHTSQQKVVKKAS